MQVRESKDADYNESYNYKGPGFLEKTHLFFPLFVSGLLETAHAFK